MAPIPPRPHQIRPIAAPAWSKSEHRNRATRLAGTGVKESKACDTTFVAKASSRAAVRVFLIILFCQGTKHFFPRSASSRAAHHRSYTRPICRCEWPASSQICSRQIQFLKVSRTGVRDRRGLDWPELITVLVDKARENCVVIKLTPTGIYCERDRER